MHAVRGSPYTTQPLGGPPLSLPLASCSYLMGEDGFCLTTFHTAVEYLKAMSTGSTQPA